MTPAWHLVTGEYPPAPGGVSDYTRMLARGLADAGETVHVWCPAGEEGADRDAGVAVHRVGSWAPSDFARVDAELDLTPPPRRLMVQWVPHAFGRRAMNVAFCRWVRRRARRGDVVDLMIHEPFLPFRAGALRHDVVAGVHRLMAAMLLGAARKVWVAIPAWADRLRPWAVGRRPAFCWLPVPSTLPVLHEAPLLERVRTAMRGDAAHVIGHFGTYDAPSRLQLAAVLPAIASKSDARFVLLGRGGEEAAARLIDAHPVLAGRLVATGGLPAPQLSAHLQACDLLVQPYVDGASTRRTTLMAALAHGVPVVTTTGRLSENFWAASRAVAAAPAGDVEGLANLAARLLSDRTRRQRQSEEARRLYGSRFSPERMIATLLEDRCEPA